MRAEMHYEAHSNFIYLLISKTSYIKLIFFKGLDIYHIQDT